MPGKRARRAPGTAPHGADPRVRELFAVEPAAFVAARNALARKLEDEGSPDANRVARLRRPTVAAWLLNAVVREHPGELEALLAAGARLRKAQARALRGDARELRVASAEMHDAIATLVAAARTLAEAHHHAASASLLADVESALRTVAVTDVPERSALMEGMLERAPTGAATAGMDLLAGLASVPLPLPSSAEREGRDERSAGPAPRAAQRDGVTRAESTARAAAARRERARAQAEADRSARALRSAEERLRRAEREVEEARQRAETARAEVDAARSATRAAKERAEAAAPAPE